MTTLALLLAVGAVALGLSVRTRLPAAPLAIGAGVLLGLVPDLLDEAVVRDALLLSGTFLVFSVGAEIEHRHAGSMRRPAAAVALVQLALVAAIGLPLASAMALDWPAAAYLVLAISASSTLVPIHVLRARARVFEPSGRLVLGAARVQDLLIVTGLALLGGATAGLSELAWTAVLVAIVGALAWVWMGWIGPRLFDRANLDAEEKLLLLLALLFVLVGFAVSTALPAVVGALFAGRALSRFPVSGIVRGTVTSFSDFFTTIFYVGLGVTAAVHGPVELVAESAFILVLVLIRPLALLPIVRSLGLTVRSSVEIVTLLAHSGELALVVALVGLERGALTDAAFGVVVVVSVVTMTLAPWLSSDRVTWRLVRLYPSPARRTGGEPPRGHVLLIGYGEGGRAVLDRLDRRRRPVVVVDEDPAIVADLEANGVRAFRGDGADPETLAEAGAARAVAVVSTMRRPADNARLLRALPGARVLVRVFSEEEARAIRELGGEAFVEAEIAEESFLRWYEAQRAR